jgi:FMN-dependent NADH-azoreductase
MQLLHVDSSILGANSASRQLTADVVEAERRRVPGLEVVYRDLAAEPLGHISGGHLGAAQGTGLELPPDLQRDVALGQTALAEFLASDIVVVGAPMYNFTIPSQLKSWIDRITVAGQTFKYGPEGVQGLAGGKKVIIVSTRGGLYGSEKASLDHQEPYLRNLFGFLGITDISVVRAEGLGMSDHRAASMDAAHSAIAAMA